MTELLRQYRIDETFTSDGYPVEWKQIKHLIREQAGHRCIRCFHPYRPGQHEKGEWSPCDVGCRHGGPVRWSNGSSWELYDGPDEAVAQFVEAQWRILTVHHLDGDKANMRWWNLVALCQRCHLSVQSRVKMDRPYDKPHTSWFLPYVAGFYAFKYLGEDLSREEVMRRLEELLLLELRQERLFAL
jgi:hypothetical protein